MQKVAQNASTGTWHGHRSVKGWALTSMGADTTAHITPKVNTEHTAKAGMGEERSRPVYASALPPKTLSNKRPGIW